MTIVDFVPAATTQCAAPRMLVDRFGRDPPSFTSEVDGPAEDLADVKGQSGRLAAFGGGRGPSGHRSPAVLTIAPHVQQRPPLCFGRRHTSESEAPGRGVERALAT